MMHECGSRHRAVHRGGVTQVSPDKFDTQGSQRRVVRAHERSHRLIVTSQQFNQVTPEKSRAAGHQGQHDGLKI